MKKLFIILFSLGLALGASAQRHGGGHIGGHRGGFHHSTIIIGAYAPFGYYAPWGYYGGLWSPWNPFPPAYESTPSKLDLEIQNIREDYKDKIWSARHSDLSKAERKKEVHELKHERTQAIIEAQKNYYKSGS